MGVARSSDSVSTGFVNNCFRLTPWIHSADMTDNETMQSTDQVHDAEARFHDEWAAFGRPEDIDVHAAFEAPTALENRFIMQRIGDLSGKRVLDTGVGIGESSVYFALHGAHVTATDVSPGMIAFVEKLGDLHNVSLDTRVCAAESLAFPDECFDIVYAANVLHHVVDQSAFFSEMRRVLAPGGSFYTWDPIAYNPVINAYRRMATDVRTVDERPIKRAQVELARKFFHNVQHREFWMTSLAIFLKYYFVDRVHPNSDRYWKRILKETPASLRWWRPLCAIDSLLTRVPGMRWLAWNAVIWGQKSGAKTGQYDGA